jgi:hypothetical protein
MELNITEFFNTARPAYYSASAAELGDDAGRITWANATDAAETWADWLDTEDKREEFRAHVRGFGGWSEEEIAAWSDVELTALLIQMVSGDIRESGLQDGTSWEEYEADAQAGRVSGSMFRGNDGEVFYYVGS